MSPPRKRKWLPRDAYRFLALAALRSRGAKGLSKRELAWLTRSNHFMITRALVDLERAHHVTVTDRGPRGYQILITEAGAAFHERHRDYVHQNYGELLALHFQFGGRPTWAQP